MHMDAGGLLKDSMPRPCFSLVVLVLSLLAFGIAGAVFIEISHVVERRRALVMSADGLLEHARDIARAHSTHPDIREYLNALFQDSLPKPACVVYHIVLKDVDMVFSNAYNSGGYSLASDLYFVYARDDGALLATLSFDRRVLERVRVATFVDCLVFVCGLCVVGVVAFPVCVGACKRASLKTVLRRNSRFAELVGMDDTLRASLECSRNEAQVQGYGRSRGAYDGDMIW